MKTFKEFMVKEDLTQTAFYTASVFISSLIAKTAPSWIPYVKSWWDKRKHTVHVEPDEDWARDSNTGEVIDINKEIQMEKDRLDSENGSSAF